MNILIICGESYSGKSWFISKLGKMFSDMDVIHVGDVLRQMGFDKSLNSASIPGDVIADVVNKRLLEYKNNKASIVVIDNPMKNVEQAEALLKMFESWELYPEDVEVVWMTNERTVVDYSKRQRSDDNLIPQKLALWKTEGPALREFLERKNVTIVDVKNTDRGFLIVNE